MFSRRPATFCLWCREKAAVDHKYDATQQGEVIPDAWANNK